ncbi:MAG TPA: HAD family hydrolase [Chloroflexota bacterium]|nr:HAD family hydrolase [Chloroflexota bacterium]
MIEAVVFDLGGTLIEYAGRYAAWPDLETPGLTAAYDYLGQQGYTLPVFDRFQQAGFTLLPPLWRAATRHEANLRVADLLAMILDEVGVNAVRVMDVTAAAERYGAAIQAQAEVIQQAVATVAQVKAAGYRVGLVSNTMFPGALHRADMDRFGLTPYFDEMVFSADVNMWKPNADPFWQVLAGLGVAADTAVYIGDDPASDVVGGRAAGMRTVYYKSNGRFVTPPGVVPHAEIAELSELLPLLAHWDDGEL